MIQKQLIYFLKGVRSGIVTVYHMAAWSMEKNNAGVSKENRHQKIIVSLTSFPQRIGTVHFTIESIMMQKKVKPDLIELWLAESQFPQKEMSLPQSLRRLQECGLSIRWCEDLKSFKKLIPALREHPDDIIVTADDDIFYENDWLEKLYTAYQADPKNVYCHKATKFIYEGMHKFKAIGGGKAYYKTPSFLNKLVGIGGVLYPPHACDADVLKTDVFMKIAPTNDDIWFWLMCVKNNTRVAVVKNNRPKPIDVFELKPSAKLTTINDHGEKLFWKQFYNVLDEYPEIREKLIRCAEKSEKHREGTE